LEWCREAAVDIGMQVVRAELDHPLSLDFTVFTRVCRAVSQRRLIMHPGFSCRSEKPTSVSPMAYMIVEIHGEKLWGFLTFPVTNL
jgi:hypothetical protein